jgi:hypothetical protein
MARFVWFCGIPRDPRECLVMLVLCDMFSRLPQLVVGLEGDPLPEVGGGEEGGESAVNPAKRAVADPEVS